MLLFMKVLFTQFIAEMGDKTQFTAITFGANEGLSAAVVVWLASSLGLFAEDVIGLLIGYLLKSKAPEGILNTVAFFIFSILGILTLRQGFGLLLGAESSMILPLTVAVTVVFVIVCLVLYKACEPPGSLWIASPCVLRRQCGADGQRIGGSWH